MGRAGLRRRHHGLGAGPWGLLVLAGALSVTRYAGATHIAPRRLLPGFDADFALLAQDTRRFIETTVPSEPAAPLFPGFHPKLFSERGHPGAKIPLASASSTSAFSNVAWPPAGVSSLPMRSAPHKARFPGANPMIGTPRSVPGDPPRDLFTGGAPFDGPNHPLGPEALTNIKTSRVASFCSPGDSSQQIFNVSMPQFVAYPLRNTEGNNPALLVLPGGGFDYLAWEKEGTDIAAWLNTQGYSAFVLKYRVPVRGWLANEAVRLVIPLTDAQRAMGVIRSQSTTYGIDPNKLGVIGFSAGGALAVQLAWSRYRVYPTVDIHDQAEYRPDFLMLVYGGSNLYQNMLGHPHPPPTFIAASEDDQCVVAPYVRETATTLAAAGAKVEFHMYKSGRHGYGVCDMYIESGKREPVCDWVSEAVKFLRKQKAGVAEGEGSHPEQWQGHDLIPGDAAE